MPVLRHVVVALALLGGAGCIVVGLAWADRRDHGKVGPYYEVAEGWGKVLGWPLIVVGALLVGGVLAVVVARGRAPSVPEARARVRDRGAPRR